MKQKRFKTVLFDMDGTLINSDIMLIETFNVLYDLYNNGQRKTKEEVYKFSGPPMRETLKHEFPNYDIEFMLSEYKRISNPLYKKVVTLFDYTYEVVRELKEKGFKLGVVTNKQHDKTVEALKDQHLEGVFDVIIGLDDCVHGKPDAEPMLKAMELLNSTKEETIYIGDNTIDYLSATNAGIKCVLVSWGPREIDTSINPYARIKSYLELEDLLYE